VPPGKGHVLLADPSLRDGVFDKSVVLLTSYSRKHGAQGLILNKSTGARLGDLLTGADYERLRQLPVHKGGPVGSDRISFIALWWNAKSGLNWKHSASIEETVDHARRPGRLVRAFAGHAGWSPGQLEGEIQRSSWFPTTADRTILGSGLDEELWAVLMRKLSPLHRILAEAPANPVWN
jgi:putative transcriptional regulator